VTRIVDARRIASKRAALWEFAHHGSAYVLASTLVGAVALRRRAGRVTRGDLVALAVVAAVRPFFEWGLHRYVLHAEPVVIDGRTVDPGGSHRGHHDAPHDVAGALLGTRYALADSTALAVVAGGLATLAVRSSWRARWQVALTASSGSFASLLAYEWSHLLFHTGYRPTTERFRRLRANHQRHHHRDDGQWFGITSDLADRLLRTHGRDAALSASRESIGSTAAMTVGTAGR